jgi:hypothetical protein
VIERKIQTQAYWQEYTPTDQDLEELALLFLETERPMTAEELAEALIVNHCRREENLVRRQLERGQVYRPNGTFAVGDDLVFPHLDFSLGTVVEQRKGHNPEYGEFSVLTVEFEERRTARGTPNGAGRVRSFAAELQMPHKLNLPDDLPSHKWADAYLDLSADDLNERYGELIVDRLQERLHQEKDFLSFRDQWLPKGLSTEIHIGHMHLAEAMIDINQKPLAAIDMLKELDLPAEVPQSIKVFGLNLALSQDKRFDDVGGVDGPVWSLCRWVPAAVLSLPPRLAYEPVAYDRTGLDVTHLQLEREIDDDTSNLIAPPTAANASEATILLGYPHWHEGALPLTDRTRVFFPEGDPEQHTQIAFVNHADGEASFPGWVVHKHNYVYGLKDWFQANKVLPGAYVKLKRENDVENEGVPWRVGIGLIPRRMQREWVHVSTNQDGELAFRLQKRPIAYEYDELCAFDKQKSSEMNALWAREAERGRPFEELVRRIFIDLVKLSSNGMVHSKTVYGAVNVIHRCPPGRVFATLFRLPEFVTAGDGYWIYQGREDIL